MISVHVEVLPHLHRTIAAIKALGAKAGVVLNPSTPVVGDREIAGDVDFVLVMSVNPGFGGQTFIPRSARQDPRGARAARRAPATPRRSKSTAASICDNVAQVVAAGAEMLVAGNAVFGSGRAGAARTRELEGAPRAAFARRRRRACRP